MSILQQAVKKTFTSNKVRNALVKVTGFQLNQQGGIKDQILFATDVKTGEALKIIMGKAPTDYAEQQRTNIVTLKYGNNKVLEGGLVRIDSLRPAANGFHEGTFVEMLKESPMDTNRAVIEVLARAHPPTERDATSYGVTTKKKIARLDMMADKELVTASGEAFLAKVVQMLMEGSEAAKGLGNHSVFIRDGSDEPVFSITAKNVKEGDLYHTPTQAQVVAQVHENKTIMHIAQAMKHDPSVSLELMPGSIQFVTGHTAAGTSYDRQSNLFFKADFNMVNNETGELAPKMASGFRTTIVGFNKVKDRWFINSVSATFEDQITLNGLPESKAIQIQAPALQQPPAQQTHQQQVPAQQQPPAQQAYQQQAPAQQQPPAQQAPDYTQDYTQGPPPSDFSSYTEEDFDMDNLINGSDEMIEAAAAAFEQEGGSSQMGPG